MRGHAQPRDREQSAAFRGQDRRPRSYVNAIVTEDAREQVDYAREDEELLRALREEEPRTVAFCDFTATQEPAQKQQEEAQKEHRPQFKTARRAHTGIKWLLLFLILAIHPVNVSAKSGLPMLCQSKTGATAFQFPTNMKCPKLPDVYAKKRQLTLDLYKENIIKYASKGYHCIIVRQVTETFSYLFGDHNLKKSNTSYLQVSALECDTMIKTRTCSYGKLITKKDHYTTAKIHKWFFPGALWNCCRWRKFETVNCLLIPIKIYKRHAEKHMEASFGPTKECTYENEKCTLKDGTFLTWKAREEEKCSHIFYKRMAGQLWDHTWLAHNHQMALSFPSIPRALPVCNKTILTFTEQGVMIKVNKGVQAYLLSKKMPNRRRRGTAERKQQTCYESGNATKNFIDRLHNAHKVWLTNNTKQIGREYDGTTPIQEKYICVGNTHKTLKRFIRSGVISADYMASRLQALYVSVTQYSNRVFGLLISKICKNTQFSASILKAAILGNPTLAIRSLFRQEYMHAKAQKNFVQTWPCAPVVSYKIQPMEKKCTVFLPIKFYVHGMNLKGYLNPKSNIIHQTSPRISCREVELIPVCLEGKCYNYYKDGTRQLVETNKTLPFVDTNFLTIPKPPMTTFYQLTIYNWSEIQAQESWSDLAHSMEIHSHILNNIGLKQKDPLYQQARKFVNTLAAKTTFGFFSGLKIDWKQVWIFVVCLYTTVQIIYLALFKICHAERAYGKIRKKLKERKDNRKRKIEQNEINSENSSDNTSRIELQEPSNSNNQPPAEESLPTSTLTKLASVLRKSRSGNVATNDTIATIYPQVRSTVMIAINGASTEALMDSGSALTLIDHKWAVDHQIPFEDCESTASTINGTPIEISGTVKAKFQIGTVALTLVAMILKNATVPCVLGVDTLQWLGPITFDYAKRTVKFAKTQLPLAPKQTLTARVAALQTFEIPPNTIAHVMGKIDAKIRIKTALFEPEQKYAGYPVRIFDTVAHTKDEMFPLLITNYAAYPAKIYENTTLGHIEPILQDTVAQCRKEPEKKDGKQNTFLSLFKFENSCLDGNQSRILEETLTKYEAAFAKDEYDLGHLKICQHKINTGEHPPVRQRAYRVPQIQKENLKSHVDKMLEQGIIRPSSSPFASPCVLVQKKNGGSRFCVDYRKLNQITFPQFQPLPYLEQITESLHGARFLTTLDLQSGYHQLEVAEEDQHKTAFITPFGCFEFLRLPFGLSNSPATFVAALDIVLAGLQYVDCIAYLDDIIIFAKTFEEHMQKLERVLQRLAEYGLKLKPSKCQFMRKEVQFLGHIISPKGLSPVSTNTEKIRNYPEPKNVKHVRQFLGLVGYYRKFIVDFAKKASPLFNLVKKDTKFTWGPEQKAAFISLRDSLMTAPVLIFPDFTKPFFLQTDASNLALGAVLSQETPEGDKPIAFASRALSKTEKHFAVVEKEACALVFAVRHFKEYLWGRKFLAIVDHAPLKYLLRNRDSNPRLMRWSLFLQQFNFEIIYRPGKKHGNADVMSRLPQAAEIAAVSELSANPDLNTMKQLQDEEPIFKAIKDKLRNNPLSKNLTKIQKQFVSAKWPQFRMKNDLLYHQGPQGQLRLALPEEARRKTFIELHSALFGAHLGYEKTLSRIAKFYYWPNMTEHIRQWSNDCMACATRKNPVTKIKVPLVPIMASKPMEMVGVDVVGPLPTTEDQNKYIVVFVCLFTRWVEAYAVPSQKSAVVARLFVERFVTTHGTPKKLLSDKGPNFTSELFREICKLTNTEKVYTTAFHPECDGQVENFNKTLINMLSFYTSQHQKDWDTHIPYVLYAYRTSEHASTKESPYYLMYGRHARHFHDLVFNPLEESEQTIEDYRHELVKKLTLAWQVANDNLVAAKDKQKKYYDKKVTFAAERLNIGDRVFLHIPYAPRGKCSKLLHHWRGPYRVLEVTPTNCKILSVGEPKSRAFYVHLNRVKIDNSSDPTPTNEQSLSQPISESTDDQSPKATEATDDQPEGRYPLRKQQPVTYPQ